MLLMQLQNGEKFAFLNLAHHIANADGELDREERDIIEKYCSEMGVDNINYNEENFNLKETLDKIKTPKSQKIVLLVLMILVHSDNKYHRFEQNVINDMANHFQISKNQLEIYSEWGKMASGLYRQGNLLVQD